MADAEPSPQSWAEITLPDSWTDQINFLSLRDCWRLIRHCLGKNRRVKLPESMPGREKIPSYIQQEFHNLPNGNYSKRFTRGYINGFDRAMLGTMHSGRLTIAEQLAHCDSVIDLGCAGGRTSQQLKAKGIADVWGLDPSPYLLQHAANDNPDVQYVQGIAEDTGFSNARFDGIGICFLLHELPPRYVQRALAECHRILKPGGLVAICEPSPLQLQRSYRRLFSEFGCKGVYFSVMARLVHEPFASAWHASSTADLFRHLGFEVVEDNDTMPLRHVLLRKR